MNTLVKIFLSIVALLCVAYPVASFAQDSGSITEANNNTFQVPVSQKTLKAVVEEVLDEKSYNDIDGNETTLQNLKLKGISKDFTDEFYFYGIDGQITTKEQYEVGDKVVVIATENSSGDYSYVINDKIRTPVLFICLILFAVLAIAIAKVKGLKAIISLALTFVIVIFAIVPLILKGYDPFMLAIIFSLPILAVSIYFTHGINRESHIALLGTFTGVLFVGIFSLIFAKISALTGFSSDEVVYVISLMGNDFSPYSLMMGGFIIGSLGVIDDVALTQVSAVGELRHADPLMTTNELYKRAMKIGIDHVSSVINTLFLAYVGASFALIILVSYKQSSENIFMVFNDEIVATEIIRTIVGSMGILLAIPITTLIAVYAKQGEKR